MGKVENSSEEVELSGIVSMVQPGCGVVLCGVV